MTRTLRNLIAHVTVSAAFLVLFTAIVAAQDVPYLTGRVVDDAHILSDGARAQLASTLKAHEDATTNQVVVLTVPTLGGGDIESYANNVFHTWKLGQKGKDNGVLVVVVPNDHKMRIEVGYGLEGTLPDAAAGQIIRRWMTPAFKAGNYDKGVQDGVTAIVARLEGHAPTGLTPVAASATPSRRSIRISSPPMPWPMRILFGLFIFVVLGVFTVVGVMTPGMGWFLYIFLIPFWSMFPIVIIGPQATLVLVGTYLIGYPLVKLRLREQPWYQKAARELKTSGHTSIGGFAISSSGGGGGFSGGDSGGFSGGGGDSGGGGASGSW
jgi:uncharacterized protein